MNLKILDDIVRVDDKECFLMTRDLMRLEGLFVGRLAAARRSRARSSTREQTGKPGEHPGLPVRRRGQKYLSKIFNDDWMRENGFLDEQPGLGTVRDLLAPRASARRSSRVNADVDASARSIDTLKAHGISQLPVVDGGKLARHRRRRSISCATS